ncbi:MAG: glycine zipper 2TM domain-containing protein [Pseudomonadota bacterium]
MKKRHVIIAALLAASSTAWAHQYEDYARVVSSVPEYERVNSPQQQCYSEYEHAPRRRAERDFGGSIIGGLTGGLAGAQIGQGNGNKAATAVGAIAGAIIGDRVQNQGRYEGNEEREVRRCQVTDHWENRLTGYRVTYDYAGRRYTAMLPEDPGSRLLMRVNVEPAVGSNFHAVRN